MAALTEESLNKLNKPDLVALVVNLQSKMDSVNSDLVAELRKMREGFDQMKSDMSVTKKVNTLLSERLQTIEKQCWANAQYSRRECLEISGIPSSVSDNDLQDVVCTLHSMGKIYSYYVSNGTVKIKIQETSKPLSIMHISDLDKLFPDVDLSPTV